MRNWLTYAVIRSRQYSDKVLDPDFVAGVFDPALYKDVMNVSPDRLGADFARLRHLFNAEPMLADSPELMRMVAETAHQPMIEASMAAGDPPSKTLGTISSAIRDRMHALDASQAWDDPYDNGRYDRVQEHHATEETNVFAYNDRISARALTGALKTAGVFDPTAEPTLDPIDVAAMRDLELRDALTQATSAEDFGLVANAIAEGESRQLKTFLFENADKRFEQMNAAAPAPAQDADQSRRATPGLRMTGP